MLSERQSGREEANEHQDLNYCARHLRLLFRRFRW